MIPETRQISVKQVTGLRTWVSSWQLWALPLPARIWLLAVEALAVGLAVALPFVQHVDLHSLVLLGVLAGLAIGWSELVRRNERARAYLTVGDSRVQAMPMDIWSFAALIIAPSGWAVLFVLVLFGQAAIHAAKDRTDVPHRLAFNAAAAVVTQAIAGSLTDLTNHHDTGPLAITLYIGAAVLFSLATLTIVLTGMWLAVGRPPLRKILLDDDGLGFMAACLALGLTTGVLLLQAPLAVVVLFMPIALLQRGTLVSALHRNASSDSKTGVTNSSAWQRNAKLLLDECRATGKSAAVLLIDIDHFRTINSDVGHVAADRLLVAVAQAVKAEVRNDDCAGRFGGDEFVVIVEDVDVATARAIGERIRASVASTRIELESGRTVGATVSIGLAHAVAGALPGGVDELLDRADKALYASKHAGRDYVSITELAA